MEDNSKSGVESQTAVCVIYKITNTLNGKPYIGQTRQKLNRRISGHKSSKKNSALTRLSPSMAGKILRRKLSRSALSSN